MLQPQFVRSNGAGNSTALTRDVSEYFANDEYVVYVGMTSDSGIVPQAPTFPGMTWTQRVLIAGFSGYGGLGMWTGRAPAGGGGGTLTARATWSGTGGNSFAWHLQVYKNVAGYDDWWGFRGSGAPSGSATQRSHNSVYVYANVDWNVRNGSARAYIAPSGATFAEKHYSLDSAMTTYAGQLYNMGEPNDTFTYGMTTPSTQKWTQACIEIHGYDNPKAYVKTASGMDPVTLVGFSNGAGGTTTVNSVTLT